MPAILPRERYDAALAFVRESGRPLDVALLNHAVGEGKAEAALVALSEFQNPDGGFGGGLEPDTQAAASSGIATSIALRLLARLGASSRHPMVTGALGWLDASLDRERGVWPIVPREVASAPHAPWWAWSANLADSWNGFRFNPTAVILAWLYAYRAAAPDGLIETAEAAMRRTLAETSVIEGAYDLKCAARLSEARDAPSDLAAPLAGLVRRSLGAHDPNDEHLSVLEIAPTPASAFGDAVAGAIEPALGASIAGQQADGGWTMFWDWSFVDAKDWAKAKKDWRGWLTREAIETLRAYGRVEGV
ncbi:MAG TPA: hypothetical protein VME40_00490 [Caulobacteraceae bacterium]|nr:hypothetical protein [Caulobacteraceae bacterium]